MFAHSNRQARPVRFIHIVCYPDGTPLWFLGPSRFLGKNLYICAIVGSFKIFSIFVEI